MTDRRSLRSFDDRPLWKRAKVALCLTGILAVYSIAMAVLLLALLRHIVLGADVLALLQACVLVVGGLAGAGAGFTTLDDTKLKPILAQLHREEAARGVTPAPGDAS